MRVYTQRHLDDLGQRCREALCVIRGPGWPARLALSLSNQLSLALTLVVDAEMQLGEQHDVGPLLLRAEKVVLRAYKHLRVAYHKRQVPGSAFKLLGLELVALLDGMRDIRKGLLAPPRFSPGR